MNNIRFETKSQFLSTASDLEELLDININKFSNDATYANTQASLVWIIRGCIGYFDKLNEGFLGEGNAHGIPCLKADHFANNLYRLINSINYLGELWNFKIKASDELNFLKDIRTLIVHSGEKLSKIESLELNDYKDSQLGRIFKKGSQRAFPFPKEYLGADYCIEIWNDKHSKAKQYNMSQVDYHIENTSYLDCSIYISSCDVRNFVLCYIETFLNDAENIQLEVAIKEFPKIKGKIIDRINHEIDFKRISVLISKNTRGGYIKEKNLIHWNGFGLQRLYEYTKNTIMISVETRNIILEKIEGVISEFWDNYQNKDLLDDEIPNLDVRAIFREYTPNYEQKGYLEGEKLFYKIAPFFNVDSREDATDIDYLFKFISKANIALNTDLSLDQSVDGIICEYFVKSVEHKLK